MKSTTTTGIIRSFPSFDYFLEKRRRISQFSQKRQDELNINRLSLFNYSGRVLCGYSTIFVALFIMPCAKMILIVKQIKFCY